MGIDNSNKRIARNSSLLYMRMLIIMCVQLYTSRVILTSLGVVDFGLYGVVGGVVVIFSTLVGAFSAATSRFFTVELGRNNYEQLRKVFSTAFALHCVIAIGIMLVCESIGLWFLNTQIDIPSGRMYAAHWLFQFSMITAMLNIIQVPYNAAIIAHEEMAVYAYVGLLSAFGNLIVSYLISLNPIDKLIWYGLLLMLLQMGIVCIYIFYCLRRYKETHFKLQHDKALYKSMLMYSSYDMIGNISVLAQGQGLNMVLNIFCGPVVNAARGIACQVESAAIQFSNNFLTAVRPRIIKFYAQDNAAAMMELVNYSSIMSCILMLMIILPLSMNINFVLSLWLGNYPEYTDTFTIIILVNALFNAFRIPRSIVNHATGYVKLPNLVTGTILCMSLPIGYLFMKLGFSPNSVFWGMLATTILADMSNLIILKRYINYSIIEFLKHVHLKCCMVTGISLLIVFPITSKMDDGFFRLIICSFLSVASLFITSWFIVLDKSQRNRALILIRSKIHGKSKVEK